MEAQPCDVIASNQLGPIFHDCPSEKLHSRHAQIVDQAPSLQLSTSSLKHRDSWQRIDFVVYTS